MEVPHVYTPLVAAACFYAAVFGVGEISRRLVDRYVSGGSLLYSFFIEAIATAQMCTCVMENVVIVRHYGALAFFFVVATVLFCGGRVNRGAFVSPLVPLEMLVRGSIEPTRLLTILAAETVGGFAAFRIARQLWYWSMSLSTDHAFNYEQTHCAFVFKIPFLYAFLFEILGCFLIRTIISRVPTTSKHYATPTVISAFLTIALVFVGVVGLNPTVAASRMFGCDGLSVQWFVITYWLCPVIGWMSSAMLFDGLRPKEAVAKKVD